MEDLRAKSEDEQDMGEAEGSHDFGCLFSWKSEDTEVVTLWLAEDIRSGYILR